MVIAKGEIVDDGTPADLEARSELHNAVTLRISVEQSGQGKAAIESIESVNRVVEGNTDGSSITYTVYPSSGQVIVDEISGALRNASVEVKEIQAERGRLDEVFRRITTMD